MTNATCIHGRRRGLSITEILVALCVFSFGLLPLVMLFQSSRTTTAKAKNLLIAETIGRSLVDEARALGGEGIGEVLRTGRRGSDGKDYPLAHKMAQFGGLMVPTQADSPTWPRDYERFNTEVVIDPVPPPSDPNGPPVSYLVKVIVSWSEGKPKPHEVVFGAVVPCPRMSP